MYKLTVTAYDCGKNRASEDVLVKISVKPTCKPSWQGIKFLLLTVAYRQSLLRCVTLMNKSGSPTHNPHKHCYSPLPFKELKYYLMSNYYWWPLYSLGACYLHSAEHLFILYSISICLSGFSKRIEYEPGTGSLALFPSMHLETCDEPITSIHANVELETTHIGKGCDRDTYSEKSLHKLCGE